MCLLEGRADRKESRYRAAVTVDTVREYYNATHQDARIILQIVWRFALRDIRSAFSRTVNYPDGKGREWKESDAPIGFEPMHKDLQTSRMIQAGLQIRVARRSLPGIPAQPGSIAPPCRLPVANATFSTFRMDSRVWLSHQNMVPSILGENRSGCRTICASKPQKGIRRNRACRGCSKFGADVQILP